MWRARTAVAADDTAATQRAVWTIAAGTGIASFAMNFWIPFLPLFMKDLGAGSDADAVFWAGLATAAVGIARLVSGPVWGILSDRFGRKVMFVRALAFASLTTMIAAFAQEPWHVVAAFTCQGLFSGFIPAAVALTSVTVPDSRLSSGLGTVSAAQYLGTTVGPALGGLIAVFLGLRGAVAAAAVMPLIASAVVWLWVPRDTVAPRRTEGPANGPPWWTVVSLPFVAIVSFYFFIFAANQVLRLGTPVALEGISGQGDVKALAGLTFTAGGIGSVTGLLVVGRGVLRPGRFRAVLAAGCMASALAHVSLAIAGVPLVYVAAFAMASLFNGVMLPATNTMIAATAGRDRRGTAFGIASSAQAMAFIAGPMLAAVFAANSVQAGWLILAAAFVAGGAAAMVGLREPAIEATPAPAPKPAA